jgi:uncharacterized protein YcfL
MKTFAITAAVLSLGLAACSGNEANTTNETAVEANAEYDVNVATNDAAMTADNSLNAADNALDNAANSVANASDAVENSADNAM